MTAENRRRILIIEDDPEIVYLLQAILVSEDREILTAASGAEARAIFEHGGLDLVVLDLILPDVDGRVLLSELRARAETAVTPVVVVTAKGGAETRKDCYALGADAFVEKPFDPEEFAADVSVRLARVAQAEQAALHDPLTGLLNRAGLHAESMELDEDYGLSVIELEGFDVFTERLGWEKAERVEAEVGRALESAMPEEIRIARIGGGDFALLMPGADLDAISFMAEEALRVVRALSVPDVDVSAGDIEAMCGATVAEAKSGVDQAIDEVRQRIFRAHGHGTPDFVAVGQRLGPGTGRVVVAEDDEISATILTHRLAKEGLDVARFADGQRAYDALLDEVPDLVILDVKMPGLDGFEVLERLRADARYVATPIVMLTTMGKEADVVRGFRLGADDYIQKPFSPAELSARVRRLLRRGRAV